MKGSAVLERSKACCEFLKVCLENDVIPNSCKVKINAKPCQSNVIANLRKQNLREASKIELELAIDTEEIVTANAEEKLKANLQRLSEKYSGETLESLVNRLEEKKLSQFWHYQNQYKKKFNFLNRKQHQGVSGDEEQEQDGDSRRPSSSPASHAGLETTTSSSPTSGRPASPPAPPLSDRHLQAAQVKSKKTRRFVKRGKYRRVQRKKTRGKVKLTTNYSDFVLTPAQERVLNRGLNFCPQPTAVNRTKVEASLKRMARTISLADYFHGMDREREEEE